MEIVQNLVSPERYPLKCPYPMEAEFYVVHNTDNDAPAANEVAYMIRNDNTVSFHYAVDDTQVVQGIPEDRNAWHCGDGGQGEGNRKGIGVEICWSLSGGVRFAQAERNAAKFLARGLREKGWGMDRVRKHQDFNGKNCPARTMELGWERFLDMIREEMTALDTGFRDVPGDAWYAEEVAYSAGLGLMVGKAEGIFDPEAPVTRAELAAVAARLHRLLTAE